MYHLRRKRPNRPQIDRGSGWWMREGEPWDGPPLTTYDAMADYPPKQPGQHRWAVSMIYTITEADVLAGHCSTNRTNLTEIDVFCVDCRLVWKGAYGTPCDSRYDDTD